MYNEVVLTGVALSLIFTELTGLSPAGLIVPGYIALSLQTPVRAAYTLAISFLAWGIMRLMSRFMILYGRRRFTVLILLTYILNFCITGCRLLSFDPGMIGALIPGIIANEFEKQGILKSLLSLAVVVAVLVMLMMWHGMRVFPI